MKKFLAIIALAAIAAISGCGTPADSADGSSAETTAASQSEGKKHTMAAFEIEDTTEQALQVIKERAPLFHGYLEKRMRAPMTIVSSRNENGSDYEYGIYIKNATCAAMYSDNPDGTRTTVIYDKDTAYQIEDSEKAVYVVDYGEDAVKQTIENLLMKIRYPEAVNAKYTSGVENIDGIDYNYESVELNGVLTYFYFDNGTNDIRYTRNDDVLAKITEFSNEITDESVFEIPSDYERRTFDDLMAKYSSDSETDAQ